MVDPDLQIRGGGGAASPLSFGGKLRGGGVAGPSPGSATDIDDMITEFARLKSTHLALCL